jgi:hypothetical protein
MIMRNRTETDRDANTLVDQIVQLMTNNQREWAVHLARKAYLGHEALSSVAFATLLVIDTPAPPLTSNAVGSAEIWILADTLFSGESARYRVLIGRLIVLCGPDYALGVMRRLEADETQVTPASFSRYIEGAMGKFTRDQAKEDFAPATECNFGPEA